jgi:hypothetical protein
MRPYLITSILVLFCLYWLAGCKKDSKDLSLPVINLSSTNITGKSEHQIQVTVSMTLPDGFKQLLITKGVNLKIDSAYGTNGVLTANASSTGTNTYQYIFTYTLSPDEVDKLVGFLFVVTDNKGRSMEKDLTVNTTVSGAQTIFSHKWALVSKLWKSAVPPSETITDCEKDDTYQFNRDSTMSINYGTLACTFDGFNIYDKWTLSPDEKIFTQTYHSVFNPAAITIDTFNVISIASDKLVMSTVVDLSAFGPPYTDHEQFIYTYNAVQ